MKITHIKKKGGRRNLYSVFIDGKFAFSTTSDRLDTLNLRVGKSLNRLELKEILKLEEKEQALQYAFLLLSYRQRTESEIFKRLKKKNFSVEVAEYVVKKLHRIKYLDDLAFSRSWIENRLRKSPRSNSLLYLELIQKGVRQGTARKALKEAFGGSDIDEGKLAWESIEKKIPRYRNLERDKAKRRIYSFLARRGYSEDAIRSVIVKFFGEGDL